MPELLEVETYRQAAIVVVGRTIDAVPRIDPLSLRGVAADLGPEGIRSTLVGRTITGADRHGKLLMLTTDGPVIGLRFGMTGRILVDGAAPIGELAYGASRDDEKWDRTEIRFRASADSAVVAGSLVVRDPRRLGRLELDPDRSGMGPEASTITTAGLDLALGMSTAPLKARLLDQARIAGLGNLLVDETLFRAGLDPKRPAATLVAAERRALAEAIVATVTDLGRRGGSHMGDLQASRRPDGCCPRDGALLDRRTVGGRTTYSCPEHQR